MNDSEDKSELSTGLGERLLRRHHEPIGVVDVNHPERIYDRTEGWIAQRFALLDHWKSRYENSDSPGAVSGQLVLSRPRVQSNAPVVSAPVLSSTQAPRPNAVASAPPSVARLASSAPAVSTGPASPAVLAPLSLPRQQYRVRRPNVRPADVDSNTSSNADPASSSGPSSFKQSTAPDASPVISPQTDQSSYVGPMPQRAVDAPRLRVRRQPAKVQEASAPLKEPAAPGRLPLRVQRESMQTSESLPRQTISPRVAVDPVRNSTAADLRTVSPAPETRSTSAGQQRAVTSEIRVAPDKPQASAIVWRTRTESAPRSDNTATEPGRNETAATSPVSPAPPVSSAVPASSPQPLSTALPTSSPLSASTTLPLRINRSAQATTETAIARNAADSSSPGQTPAESIMRTATSSEAVMREESSPSSYGGTQSGSVDLEYLAEQVGRLLSKQLAVERERRGIKEWN